MYKQAGRVSMALVGANLGNLAGNKLSNALGFKRNSWADAMARYGLGAAGMVAGGYFGNKYSFDKLLPECRVADLVDSGLGAYSLYSLLKRHYQLDQPSNNVFIEPISAPKKDDSTKKKEDPTSSSSFSIPLFRKYRPPRYKPPKKK